MTRYYLRFGDEYLDSAVPYGTKADAVAAFGECMAAADRRGIELFGVAATAYIHIAGNRDEIVEDPDFVLSIGPRGGIRCERA